MKSQTKIEFLITTFIFLVFILISSKFFSDNIERIVYDIKMERVKAQAENIVGILVYEKGIPENWELAFSTSQLNQNQQTQLSSSQSAISWWNSNWQYRKPIVIKENSGNDLYNYQVKIELNSSNFDFSKANNDGSDIRFTYNASIYELPITITEQSGNDLTNYQVKITITNPEIIKNIARDDAGDIRFFENRVNNPYTETTGKLSYWVEKFDRANNLLIVWVKVPSIPASSTKTIYMYYGNALASSESNPEQTMFIYENFSQAPSGNLAGSATYDSTNKWVQLTPNTRGQLGYLYYTKVPTNPTGFYARFYFWAGGGNGADAVWIGAYDTSYSGTREDIVNGGYHFTYDEYQDRICFTKSATDNGAGIRCVAQNNIDNSQWHLAEVYFWYNGSAANTKIYYDGVLKVNAYDTNVQSNVVNGVGQFIFGGRTGGLYNYHRIGNGLLYVVKYIYPEPSTSIGTPVLLKTQEQKIPYWIESWDSTNQKAIIWVKIPYIPANGQTTVYLYYGNVTPVQSESNGTATFEFFDDFETWSGWVQYGSGVVSQATNILGEAYTLKKAAYCDPNGGYKLLPTPVNDYRLFVKEARIDNQGTNCPWDRYGIEDANWNGYGIIKAGSGSANYFGYERRDNAVGTGGLVRAPITPQGDTWFITELKKVGSSFVAALYDDNHNLLVKVSGTETTYPGPFDRVVVRGGIPYYIAWIAIGKATSVEPSTSIGNEQIYQPPTQPTPPPSPEEIKRIGLAYSPYLLSSEKIQALNNNCDLFRNVFNTPSYRIVIIDEDGNMLLNCGIKSNIGAHFERPVRILEGSEIKKGKLILDVWW